MTPSYETMGDWLEEISQAFPDAFFEDLDGGIQLEEEALPDPEFPPGEMYIMGEYCHDVLGRYIVLYYGSFAALPRRPGRTRSSPPWPTSSPTTWRTPPASTPWTTRTRRFSVRRGSCTERSPAAGERAGNRKIYIIWREKPENQEKESSFLPFSFQ